MIPDSISRACLLALAALICSAMSLSAYAEDVAPEAQLKRPCKEARKECTGTMVWKPYDPLSNHPRCACKAYPRSKSEFTGFKQYCEDKNGKFRDISSENDKQKYPPEEGGTLICVFREGR